MPMGADFDGGVDGTGTGTDGRTRVVVVVSPDRSFVARRVLTFFPRVVVVSRDDAPISTHPALLLPPSLHRRAAQDHRRELENGETDANPFAAADDGGGGVGASDEPDWLRDFEKGKRGRDFSEKMKRRAARRAKARRLAAAADRAFAAAGGSGVARGRPQPRDDPRASAEERKAAAAMAAGASTDEAREEAEFLADEWRDDAAGNPNPDDDVFRGARADDSSSDDDGDDPNGNTKRRGKRNGAGAGPADGDSSDEDAAAPTQVIFCSRTHSQLTQVVGELNSTSFGGPEGTVNAIAIASRAQLCVNPEVRSVGVSNARLNERCLELGKPTTTKSSSSATATDPATGKKKKKNRRGVSVSQEPPRRGRGARGRRAVAADGHRRPRGARRAAPRVPVLRRPARVAARGPGCVRFRPAGDCFPYLRPRSRIARRFLRTSSFVRFPPQK